MGGLLGKVRRGNKGQATQLETGWCGELWALRDVQFGHGCKTYTNKNTCYLGGLYFLDGKSGHHHTASLSLAYK